MELLKNAFASRSTTTVRRSYHLNLFMGEQSKGFRPGSVAVIISALLVSASVLLAASPYGLGGTKTVTEKETSTTTMAQTPPTLHKVTFNETGSGCTAGYVYDSKWYVTMANITIAQPSNATLPFPNDGVGYYSGKFVMISKIVFTVPDGPYPYYASIGPQKGTVIVDGSDVVIQVLGPFCL